MPKILVLNGPPYCGKDTLADILVNCGWYKTGFKLKLIEIALCVSRIPKTIWDARYATQKDEPWDALNGLSQRQYLIKISEEWVKPTHGKKYFGLAVADFIKLLGDDAPPIVLSDSGFDEEVEALETAFGRENIHIMRITMAGKNYAIDSRRGLPYHTTFENIHGQIERLEKYARELAVSHQMLWPANYTKIKPSEY